MSKSKKKTTEVVTPNAPAWVSPQTQALTAKTAGLADADPYSFVAGADPLQTQAATTAAGITGNAGAYGTSQDALQKILSAQAPTVQSASLLDGLQKYMNPYTQDVVNTSLADYDHGAGQQMAQSRLLAGNLDDTFGGSNWLLSDSMLGGELARGRGALSSGLYKDSFNTGANLSNLDAGRRQDASTQNASLAMQQQAQQAAAAQGLAGIASTQDADTRATAGTQADIGSILQQIAQARAGAPLSVQQAINQAYGSLNPSNALLTGQTTNSKTTTSGSLMNTLGKVAQIAATVGPMFVGLPPVPVPSDARLKTDVETIGHDARGRRWVNYRYLWDEPGTKRQGVIAQEVAKTDPGAVVQHPHGYLMVKMEDLV